MVIYHLREALLDIIDLNLSPEELKEAVSDYLGELLEAGPIYVEGQKHPERSRQNNSSILKQLGFSLRQCPPQQSQPNLNFPFTGQDPRASTLQDYQSPPNSITPAPISTPQSLRHQSDPVSRTYQHEADFSRSAQSEQTFGSSRRGANVRRNLFPRWADCCPPDDEKPFQPKYPAKGTDLGFSDYIEEFEKYIQHKYSSPECLRDVKQEPSSGGGEVCEGAEAKAGCQDNLKNGTTKVPLSRFELFLRDAKALETCQQLPTEESQLNECEEDAKALDKLTEDGGQVKSSRFEQFLRDCEVPEASSDSGESMTEEEFYRELLRVNPPNKS